MAEKFSYTYKPDVKSELEAIRKKYDVSNENNQESEKIIQLRKLDKKAESLGMMVAILLGLLGVVLIVLGIRLIMTYANFVLGVIMTIVGLVFVSITPAVNSAINKKQRKKYAAEILKLLNEITKENA